MLHYNFLLTTFSVADKQSLWSIITWLLNLGGMSDKGAKEKKGFHMCPIIIQRFHSCYSTCTYIIILWLCLHFCSLYESSMRPWLLFLPLLSFSSWQWLVWISSLPFSQTPSRECMTTHSPLLCCSRWQVTLKSVCIIFIPVSWLQAKLILSYEEKLCSCHTNRYLKYIHDKCSPHAEFYDDDEYFSKETNLEVKKITHQIHVSSISGAWRVSWQCNAFFRL